MSQPLDFMQTLGLCPPCTIEDVDHAFRRKALTCHPDRGGDPEAFRELYDAYDKAKHFVRFRSSRREWLGELVERYAQQEQLVRALESAGGRVVIETNEWMDTLLGGDFSQVTDRLIQVDLSGVPDADNVLDQILEAGEVRKGLRMLNLSGIKVASANLRRLDQLKDLEELGLNHSQLTIDDLRALEPTLNNMPSLQRLELVGNRISWFQQLELRRRHRDVKLVFSRRKLTAQVKKRQADALAKPAREYQLANREDHLPNELLKIFGRKEKSSRRRWWEIWK